MVRFFLGLLSLRPDTQSPSLNLSMCVYGNTWLRRYLTSIYGIWALSH